MQYLLLFLIAVCFSIITCAILGFLAVWGCPVELLNLFSNSHPFIPVCSVPVCNRSLTQLGKFMPSSRSICMYRM